MKRKKNETHPSGPQGSETEKKSKDQNKKTTTNSNTKNSNQINKLVVDKDGDKEMNEPK